MATYRVKVSAGAAPCNHVHFTVERDGANWRQFAMHLDELREALSDTSWQDFLIAEIKLLIAQNPSATKAQLKTLIEAQEWTV